MRRHGKAEAALEEIKDILKDWRGNGAEGWEPYVKEFKGLKAELDAAHQLAKTDAKKAYKLGPLKDKSRDLLSGREKAYKKALGEFGGGGSNKAAQAIDRRLEKGQS